MNGQGKQIRFKTAIKAIVFALFVAISGMILLFYNSDVSITSSPFWKSPWFYGFSVIFALCLAGGFYHLKFWALRSRIRDLENDATEHTAQLEKLKIAHNEALEKAHKAGMADIATVVLHNVGNILNSVKTSGSLIKEKLKQSKIESLIQANGVLREHIDQIDRFVTENPKGKSLLGYYLKLEEPLRKERDEITALTDRLTEKIDLIQEVIAAQQNFAGASLEMEAVSLSELIDNALTLQARSIERVSLQVTKKLNAIDDVMVHRSKLIHILVNILDNAVESMEENHPENKNLVIETWQNGDSVHLSVTDNGMGIKRENLDKIFSHTFTTKENGHGFGLHGCANYMTEMGGRIEVASDGEGKGASFTLMFPKPTAEIELSH